MRPIDADYARSKLISAGRAIKGTADSKRFTKLIGILVDKIDAAPTLSQVPVKIGEWLEGEQLEWTRWASKCSLCGSEQEFATNYCPNCGALMDGGKKDG